MGCEKNATYIAKIPVWEKCNALLYDSWWNSEITLDIPNKLFVISFHCNLNRLVEIVFTFYNPEWQVGIMSCFEWHVILPVSSHCSMPWHLILSISSHWSMPWHVILSFFPVSEVCPDMWLQTGLSGHRSQLPSCHLL